MQIADEGHGFDRFGMSREGVRFATALLLPLYQHYFRVDSHDSHHIPASGPAILACNHSGMLPIDAMMLASDVLWHTDPPRMPRVVADYFVPMLPAVSVLFARAGTVGGSRANVHNLLGAGELVALFPEGVTGIGKPFKKRYQLQEWRVGHAELAIAHQVPIVPCAVIGAEEQWPQVARIHGFHLFGAPYLPIPATPLPMPVHYHIWYGAPIPIPELYDVADSQRAAKVREAAERVRDAVAGLIERGLQERPGVFR